MLIPPLTPYNLQIYMILISHRNRNPTLIYLDLIIDSSDIQVEIIILNIIIADTDRMNYLAYFNTMIII